MGKQDMVPWMPVDDIKVVQLFSQYGPRWRLITDQFPGRTVASVRNRYLRMQTAEKIRSAGGITRNRCQLCGQPKRGHICPKKMETVIKPMREPTPAVLVPHGAEVMVVDAPSHLLAPVRPPARVERAEFQIVPMHTAAYKGSPLVPRENRLDQLAALGTSSLRWGSDVAMLKEALDAVVGTKAAAESTQGQTEDSELVALDYKSPESELVLAEASVVCEPIDDMGPTTNETTVLQRSSPFMPVSTQLTCETGDDDGPGTAEAVAVLALGLPTDSPRLIDSPRLFFAEEPLPRVRSASAGA